MATAHLLERPDLAQLRRQARELQRAVRTGAEAGLRAAELAAADSTYPLHQAQLILARHYGFASWPRLCRHVQAINARTWTPAVAPDAESLADRFVRLACLSYAEDDPRDREQAAELLARHEDLAETSVAAAAVSADVAQLSRWLESTSGAAATAATGPRGWPPLMYLTYSRVPSDRSAVLGSAELLLAHGADPNDGRFFDGLPTPFTALTGCFGGGEQRQPPHPHAIPLARLLLSHGAEPNDPQTLYNRMFGENDDFLEVLFEYGLGRGDGGPWRRLLPDLIPSPSEQLRALLHWAVVHDQRARVTLLIAHGLDIATPLPAGRTALEIALMNGNIEMAAQLRRLGAGGASLDPIENFIAAALAGRTAEAQATPPAVIAATRDARPGLIVWATGQQRIDAVELLAAAGFDVNAYGRGDVPVEQEWQTALHTAAERRNTALVRRLLHLGANPQLRDTRFHATPRDWAEHLDHLELVELLDKTASKTFADGPNTQEDSG